MVATMAYWTFLDHVSSIPQVEKSETNLHFLTEFLGQFAEKLPNDSEVEDPKFPNKIDVAFWNQ